MIKYLWEILPLSSPAVLKNCPKCGNRSVYQCSGNFRVNANQNHIDVWLIYLCEKCKSTWNMEILSRRDKKSINRDLYEKFLGNDPELARQYAFDISTHNQNKSTPDYGNLPYDLSGDSFSLLTLKEAVELEILCKYPVDVRLDMVLSRKLQVSREYIKRMTKQNKIWVEGFQASGKEKVKNGLRINILP